MDGEITEFLELLNKLGYFSNYFVVVLEDSREAFKQIIALNIQVLVRLKRFRTILKQYLNCVWEKYLVLPKDVHIPQQ